MGIFDILFKSKKDVNVQLRSQPKALPSTVVIQNIKARAQKDIKDWRNALNMAEKSDNPRRYLLVDIYREIMLDPHLSSQIDLRKNRVLGAPFQVYDSNNKPNTDITWMLKQPAIQDIISHLLDALFFGHSLIQIDEVIPNQINKVSLVPRQHIVPELGLLLKNPNDSNGLNYRTYKDFQNYIIESPNYTDLGLLAKVVPYVLYKRFALAAWSEFAELFGNPIRVAKTNVRDTTMTNRLYNMLKDMGSLFFAVIDKDEELDFIETTRSNGEVFQSLINLCNNEISKLINGAVVGENNAEGSRAKEQVGYTISQDITNADKRYIEQCMNKIVFPILIYHGYPLQNCTFAYDEQIDMEKLWNNTYQALQYYNIDTEWIKERFGIPVLERLQNQQLSDNRFFE